MSLPRTKFVKYKAPDNNSEVTIYPKYNDPAKQPETTIIIPTADGYRDGYLPKLLQQIRMQQYQHFEIIVVKGDPRPGRAINTAVSLSKGQFFIILDDDVQLGHPKLFTQLIKTLKESPEIGMVGVPNLVAPKASSLVQKGMSQIPRRTSPMVTEITNSDLAEHACCAVPRNVFLQVGGENELIPRGVDPYFRHTVRTAGYRVVVIPHVYIHHLLPANIKGMITKFYNNGKKAAYVNKFYPQFVVELATEHNQAIGKKRSTLVRMVSLKYRLIKALLSGKFIYFLSMSLYLWGYLYGYATLKKNDV